MNSSFELAEKIRKGEIDINNQSRFFSILIKGLLWKLRQDISIRGKEVPHYILNTGDETMMLELKGEDYSIEPLDVSNENYIYTILPRCSVSPKGINLQLDQLSSPYSNGHFQYEGEDIVSFVSEFRRIPLNMSFELTYLTDSYSDYLELIQQIVSKLAFIKTYNITYLGQNIVCSYSIPDSFDGDHMIDFDEATTDDRRHKLSLSIEVATNFPLYDNRTVIPADKFIKGMTTEIKVYPADGIKNNGPYEIG